MKPVRLRTAEEQGGAVSAQTQDARAEEQRRATHREPQAVTYLRARLVAKGTVFTQGRSLRFAVPGMAAWIGEHDPG